jgi:photosystem II stability/assembly factor-like uncharacterized protein
MHLKIKRILITALITGLFLIGSYFSTAGQAITNITYLPLVSHNLTGWIGPYGGYITAIVIDQYNPQIVYAGSWGAGVFKTQDSGQKWLPVNLGLANLYINSMAIDPKNSSTLYAGTYKNQVYKSTDGGNSWMWSGTGMQDQAIVYSIAINPGNPNFVYAATRGISNNGAPPWNGVVYRSQNAGQTWDPVLSNVGGESAQDWVYSLAVSPHDTKNVFAASHEHGPYYSPSNGDTWNPLPNGIQDNSGRAIVINPVSDNILYYGVWHDDAVYKSYNQGSNWIPANSGIKYAKIYSMAISPENTDSVYLATFNRGLLNSQDGGYHWHDAGLQGDFIYSIVINPAHTAILYAGTAGDGLQKSTYYGIDWKPANSGIDNAMTTSILLSPSNPKSLFTSLYGAGVFQSSNRGSSWSEMNTGLMDKFVHTLVQDPTLPGVIYALTDTAGLFKNDTNNSNGWVSIGQGLPPAQDSQPAYPEDHPFATREMQDVVTNPESDISAIQLASENLLTMVFAPSTPQIAYIGTGGSGVYKSVDGALTWSPAGLNGESVQSLAVDPSDPDLLYAALATPGSLKISLNGGVNWTDSSLPVTIYCLATSTSMPGILFAGTSNGLYRYEGGIWTPLALADQEVTAITIDPLHPERIFAGTSSNGAFFSSDGGSSWEPVDQKLNGHTIQSINFDTLLPNYIYFATKTHGIYLLTKSFK